MWIIQICLFDPPVIWQIHMSASSSSCHLNFSLSPNNTQLAADVGIYWTLSHFLFAVSKNNNNNVWVFVWEDALSLITFYFFPRSLNCKTCLRLYRLSREKLNPATLPFPPSNLEITRKVLLQQMVDVKYVDHLLFPIYIALVISQLVHGDSRLKLYPIYLADQLHIQASHLPTVEMYLNWGLFIPGTPGESPPYFFFLIWITVTHSVPHCSFFPECSFLPLQLL